MTEAYSEVPRRMVALSLVHELDESRAGELGLLVSQEDFAQLDLDISLPHQENLHTFLRPQLGDCWSDLRNTFAVVCGTSIFVSRQPTTSFDQIGFDEGKPYYSTVIPRPETVTIDDTPTKRTRWLQAVPDLK